jgi:hypothetical protein
VSTYLVRYANEPEDDWTEVEVDEDNDGEDMAAQVFAELKQDPRDGPHTVEVDVRAEDGEDTTRFRVYIEATWTYSAFEIPNTAEKAEGED